MIDISLFASGSGSNVEEIFKYFKGHPKIKVDSLFCNNDDAYVIERAKSLNLHQIIFTASNMTRNRPDRACKIEAD